MPRKLSTPFLFIAICLSALWIAALAPAKMHSVKIAGGLCQTTGGAKIVPVPGFPGERIDKRVLPDLKHLIKKYKLFLVDGYSGDPVHASNGEHPMGLAADLVPNTAKGGNWNLVDKLAHKVEPVQDQPVAPFRWVGYDGDAGHGRGNHLHLSWNHSDLTGTRRFPKTVITTTCPGSTGDTGSGHTGDNDGGPKHHGGGSHTPSGGVGAGNGKGDNKSHHSPSGGVSPKRLSAKRAAIKLAPVHPESAAESLR
jgi:hypothetical protein